MVNTLPSVLGHCAVVAPSSLCGCPNNNLPKVIDKVVLTKLKTLKLKTEDRLLAVNQSKLWTKMRDPLLIYEEMLSVFLILHLSLPPQLPTAAWQRLTALPFVSLTASLSKCLSEGFSQFKVPWCQFHSWHALLCHSWTFSTAAPPPSPFSILFFLI